MNDTDWRMTTIRIPKEFEDRVKADYIDKFAMKESFNTALFKLASFALEFFKVTKRLDIGVLEEIKGLQQNLTDAENYITNLELEGLKATDLRRHQKWLGEMRERRERAKREKQNGK